MEADLIKIILTIVIGHLMSVIVVVRALRVHIDYLREGLADNKASVRRAHERISGCQQRLENCHQ